MACENFCARTLGTHFLVSVDFHIIGEDSTIPSWPQSQNQVASSAAHLGWTLSPPESPLSRVYISFDVLLP